MARKRKSTGKKLRFDVFKRDRFTCQYCGRKAPDVVLVCDHVAPVAKGGETSLLNLITSCYDCNSGKGARELSDDSAVAKQRAELDRLAERREQIDMMIEWSRGLADTIDYELDAFKARWRELLDCQFSVNERGAGEARKWLRTFGLQDLLAAADRAAEQYLKRDAGGKISHDSANLAWSRIPGVARILRLPPAEQELYYIRGIARKCIGFDRASQRDSDCLQLMRAAHSAGADMEWLRELAKRSYNFTEFRDAIYLFLEDRPSGDDL